MWIAVLLVLLVTGSIFYGLAIYYMNLLNYKGVSEGFEANDRKMSCMLNIFKLVDLISS